MVAIPRPATDGGANAAEGLIAAAAATTTTKAFIMTQCVEGREKRSRAVPPLVVGVGFVWVGREQSRGCRE